MLTFPFSSACTQGGSGSFPAVQKELAARWVVVYQSFPVAQIVGRWVSQALKSD